eukprot:765958-Hanusia_phi.AAC.2
MQMVRAWLSELKEGQKESSVEVDSKRGGGWWEATDQGRRMRRWRIDRADGYFQSHPTLSSRYSGNLKRAAVRSTPSRLLLHSIFRRGPLAPPNYPIPTPPFVSVPHTVPLTPPSRSSVRSRKSSLPAARQYASSNYPPVSDCRRSELTE